THASTTPYTLSLHDALPISTDGLADCAEHPNTCNSGERADGGDITWIVDSLPGAWATLSPEGGSVYTLQMLHGTLPHTGHWEPRSEEHTSELQSRENLVCRL